MSEHYVVTVDFGHLRIFAERGAADGVVPPRLEVVESLDFPSSSRRRPANEPASAAAGDARQNLDLLAAEVDTFLAHRPDASWDFAVAPSLYGAMMDEISIGTRSRLKRALPKDLASQNAEEVREQFATADWT